MNLSAFVPFAALATMLSTAGCGSIDVTPEGNPNRVLTGTVTVGAALPAGAEITVRLVAAPSQEMARTPAATDMPVATRPTPQSAERVLGEQTQTLSAPTTDPVPFRVAYVADDAMLRRGLSLEARVSFGGRVRYRSFTGHVVTLGNAPYKQDIAVQAVAR